MKEKILEHGMKLFAINGFDKASIEDIAKDTGVSKALIFHYFGNKKNLIMEINDLFYNVVKNGVNEIEYAEISDFFDRLIYLSNKKIEIMKKYPFFDSYAVRIMKDSKQSKKTDYEDIKKFFNGIDMKKFKQVNEIDEIIKIVILTGNGYLDSVDYDNESLEDILNGFKRIMLVLKTAFYKEKYHDKSN